MPYSLNFKRDHYCEEDQLGYKKYIDTLGGMIRAEDFDTPFCIGIYGKWGSGKTSFMRQLEKELKKNPHKPYPVTVWFSPWRYEKEEHLIVPFLKTIEQVLKEYSNDQKHPAYKEIKSQLKKASDKASIAARAFAYGAKVKFFGLADFSGKDMIEREKEITNEQKEKLTQLAETLPSVYYDITKHLKETVSLKEFRLVVFIDDLDRCMPEKAVELLESIKLFLDLDGYLFVLGVDKDVVEQGIRHHYRLYNPDDDKENTNGARIISPNEYLDKMIQMPLELPPIEPTRKICFIEKLLGDSSFKEHASLIEAGMEDNPRSITRFVNYLAFMGRLAETLKDEIKNEPESPGRPENYKELIEEYFKPFFYAKWAIIVFSFPGEYQNIKDKTQHVFELQDAALGRREKTAKEESVGTTSDVSFPEKLKKILAMSEPFPEETWLIRKFIHLSASVGLAVSEQRSSGDASKTPPKMERHATASSFGDMVVVKKGPFLYGDEKKQKSIDYDYEIDIYPVTNGQYRQFIDKKGYSNQKYWSKDGWAWLKDRKVNAPELWDDEKSLQDDHPVVGVCFYEAEAFASWSEKRVPTEEEWEKAARGDNGRVYPWGNEFNNKFCNTNDESESAGTTPVNKYPQGKSPYGCMDMAGNVWEWNVSDYNKKTKVLRGGSWDFNRVNARCAYRYRYAPYNRFDFVGFRCARTVVK